MRLPRFLWVPFELGRPFGAPHVPDFQRRVLTAALSLLERTDGPVLLEDFTDDAPTTGEDAPWTCPVSYADDASGDRGLIDAVHDEMRRLAPWAELGAPPIPNRGVDPATSVSFLDDVLHGRELSQTIGDQPAVEAIRLATDDVCAWYLHAAGQQPGSATTSHRQEWLWRETALGRFLGTLAHALSSAEDPLLRAFAARALVPRDHWDMVRPLR